MNMLRKRIGPNPDSDYVEARRIEKLCSDFYKRQITFSEDLKGRKNFISGVLSSGPIPDGNRDTIIKTYFLPNFLAKQKTGQTGLLTTDLTKAYGPNIISFIEEYCAQVEFDNIDDFFEKKRSSSEKTSCLQFLNTDGISFEKLYHEKTRQKLRQHLEVNSIRYKNASPEERELFFSTTASILIPSWEKFVEEFHASTLFGLSFFAAAIAFGFKVSDWTPSQSIDSLQKHLKSEGALIVAGFYGKSFYSKDPFVAQSIAERPIYGWKPTDRISLEKMLEHYGIVAGHTIVVIGAAQGGAKGGFVYFVDPKDGSDPQNPLQQRVYMISYENFTSNIGNSEGSRRVGGEHSKLCMNYDAFALFYPQQSN